MAANSHYEARSDDALTARICGNSRDGYGISFSPSGTIHRMEVKRVRDTAPYIRAMANVWSESELVITRVAAP